MVSFYVASLFTRVPVTKTVSLMGGYPSIGPAVIAGVFTDGFWEQRWKKRIISPLQVSSPGQDLRDLGP